MSDGTPFLRVTADIDRCARDRRQQTAIPRHQRRQLVLNHPDRREDGRHSKANCTSSGFEPHSSGWERSIWGIPDEYIENTLLPPETWPRDEPIARDKANPNENLGFRDLCTKSYGGPWIFNEIVGYIRLHFMGNQVRGEYFAVQRKRIVRTRRKQLEFLDWNLGACAAERFWAPSDTIGSGNE